MEVTQPFMNTAFEEPTSWPTLEPQRVPQSVDWADERIDFGRLNRQRAGSVSDAGTERRNTDARSRMPPAPLTSVARSWMQELPLTSRPGLTAKRHPHVVNRLALVWEDAKLLEACFADLLVADRVGRQGFALDVLDELLKLQAFSLEPRRR